MGRRRTAFSYGGYFGPYWLILYLSKKETKGKRIAKQPLLQLSVKVNFDFVRLISSGIVQEICFTWFRNSIKVAISSSKKMFDKRGNEIF